MESIFGKNKDYLSFSSVRLWKQSKEQYRKHYYDGAPGIDTVYTRFGKRIADLLEARDFEQYPLLSKVPAYPVSEHSIEVTLNGVRVVGRLDLWNPKTFSFGEVKTGSKSHKNGPPWDAVKVARWEQLPWYSLLIKESEGKVKNKCHLIWLETEFKEQKGILRNKELCLTGEIKIFERIIFEYERKNIRKEIITIANDIQQDYATYR